ncbi:MAG: hypothetical protein U9O87_04180 [Verrucomicrobiota bacterium]|nr:hypothetical protein [Verrucomicrobiota bacterium]
MKKFVLLGRHLDEIIPILTDFSVIITDKNPDAVITYGGDGALLGAERKYPGIPKYPIRDERMNPKCKKHKDKYIIKKIAQDNLKPTKMYKLIGKGPNNEIISGLNDIILHNADPKSAVRYKLTIDDKHFPHQIVGDGVVIATPFGSSAYYKSITHSTFNLGIGIAFNNSTEPINHMVINKNSVVKITVTRGPAILLADNDPKVINIQTGEHIYVHNSEKYATVYGLDIFRCEECLKQRNQFWKEKTDYFL